MAKYIGVVTGRRILLSNADNAPVELVQNDKDTTVIDFELSKIDYVADLSQLNVAINYTNIDKDTGESVTDIYTVDKTTVEGDSLKFSWTVGSNASVYAGKCIFQIVLTLTDANDVIIQQWDSAKQSIDVHASLENVNVTQPKSFVDFVTQVKKSVSDGKELVATAITDKGVATEPTDTFATMAENVRRIESGGGIDKDLRTVKFIDNEKIIAQYAGLPGDHIMSPLDVNSKSYGGWQDVNGVFIKFPLKISEDINVYKSSKLYDLNGSGIWENGWAYSSEPTRKITDEYIEFIKNYTSSSDEKNAIQTVNKYELTNARMLRFVLNVSDTTDNTYTSDRPIFWAILLPSKNQQWGLNDYSFRLMGTEIVDGTYDVDLSSVSGEYYISFACQHKNSKADIKISNIEIYE